MDFYRIYSQSNNENKVYDPKEYATFSDAELVLRQMIAEQGKKMNVAAYISAIRKGKNGDYRRIIADALNNIFSESEPLSVEKIKQMKESIEDFTFDCCMGDKEPTDDFEAYTEGGRIVIIEFNFGQKLHVEFDINTDFDYNNDGIIGEYFFIQDRNGKFKVNIEENILVFDIPASSKSANIMLVYYCLLSNAYWVKDKLKRFPEHSDKIPRGIMLKDIQREISFLTADRILLSTESIVKHIKALKALGFPITYYKASKEEKEFWEARNKHCNEGYELDPDFPGKIPEPVDASSLGDNINPLLVRFVLQSAKKPMRQNDIIEAILKKYNVSIKRAAVGRHIDLLKKFGYSIERSKDGYILEK